MLERKINICDECYSEYYKDSSQMDALCPNCAFILYGYPNCQHKFENGRCIKCFWNGKTSLYIKNLLKGEIVKKKKSISVSFNEEDLPYIPIKKNARLTFSISEDNKSIQIIGNKNGLRLMAKALLGMAETERTDVYHLHIDDLYNINDEEKQFIIYKNDA